MSTTPKEPVVPGSKTHTQSLYDNPPTREREQITRETPQVIRDTPPAPPPYITWSTPQRRLLVGLLSYLALTSSLTANIYFPLIDLLADSIGGSAVLWLAYAVVADVTVHSERGCFLAPMLTATNIGPCIGPVIGGGAVLAPGDPRWCFRALLIFGASAVLLIGWTMPETLWSIVGNGLVYPEGLWRTWWSVLFKWKNGRRRKGRLRRRQAAGILTDKTGGGGGGDAALDSSANVEATGRGRFVIPNPLPSLRIVFYVDTFLALWLAGAPYAIWFCVQTSIAPVFSNKPYSYNPLEVGCCFLVGGVGIIAGGFIAGRLMDVNYKHVVRKAGLSIDRVRGDDISKFPVEHARSRGSILIIIVFMCAVIGYGWVVEQRDVHAAVPLLLQAYLGCKCTVIHQIYSALIVDIFPENTGTAAASNNITRCRLVAAAVAMLDPLSKALGYGWLFTLLGLFEATTCIAAVLPLRRWGW
ncbi:major facilitator superfamily domain-containing protein [Apodospora peruviana]|uniref:Major facilitator superfamily domain-containing protein n=1 Tax=Apodospora peruviana TaxID=516989 RepID=A0AAE0M0Z4_9PEZI|nr:major facilitator superfamily domain-containing protein [Apodospora peruviana]